MKGFRLYEGNTNNWSERVGKKNFKKWLYGGLKANNNKQLLRRTDNFRTCGNSSILAEIIDNSTVQV
jgi:hypothetical protein